MKKLAFLMAALLALASFQAAFAVTEIDEGELTMQIKAASVKAAKSYDEILAVIKDYRKAHGYGKNAATGAIEDVIEEKLEESIVEEEPEMEAPVEEGSVAMGSGGEYSVTNTQESDVDEADIVKTDGKYIYYLRRYTRISQSGNAYKLAIVEADDKGNMREVSSKTFVTDAGGYMHEAEMYVKNNRLALVFSESMRIKDGSTRYKTSVLVYDISDRENLKALHQFELSGSHLTTRMEGNALYVVTTENLHVYGKEDPVKEDLPFYSENGNWQLIPANNIYLISDPSNITFTNVAGIDIMTAKAPSVRSIMMPSDYHYMAPGSLYVARRVYNRGSIGNSYNTTDIVKFEVADASVKIKAVGSVLGAPLNQFSMSERDGYFRIATTVGWGNSSANNLYILDSALNPVSAVEGIAPTERIYSVRYDGDMVYMVTFRETDPLYAIDVSNPANPVVKGKLKVPGFSNYMHPVEGTLLIGVGQDASDKGVIDGLKLSMFDVKNPNSPKELFTSKLGGRGSSSPLQTSHKTMIINEKSRFFGFPVSLMNITSQNTPKIVRDQAGDNNTFGGFVVYSYSKSKGFSPLCAVASPSYYDQARGIYIGDALYVIAGDYIVAASLKTGKEITRLALK